MLRARRAAVDNASIQLEATEVSLEEKRGVWEAALDGLVVLNGTKKHQEDVRDQYKRHEHTVAYIEPFFPGTEAPTTN